VSAADYLPRAQAEEIRYQQREWKAGYAAARRHDQLTLVGVAVAMFLALRRWKVPAVAIIAWGLALAVAFWWLILVLAIIEVRRRHWFRTAVAATFTDDPFPSDRS